MLVNNRNLSVLNLDFIKLVFNIFRFHIFPFEYLLMFLYLKRLWLDHERGGVGFCGVG